MGWWLGKIYRTFFRKISSVQVINPSQVTGVLLLIEWLSVWNSSTVVFVASSWNFVAPSTRVTTETQRYTVQQCFPTRFYGRKHKIIFHIPKDETNTKRQFVAAEISPVLPTAGQNFPEIFWVIFGFFYGISKFLFVYSTTYFGTTNGGWAEPRLGNNGAHYQRKRNDLDLTKFRPPELK